MDREDRYFELLLSEKEHADSAIVGYAELNLKVIGLFGAGVILLGWLYSEKSPAHIDSQMLPTSAGVVCVLLALVGCGIILQGVSTYSLTLGYIQYKNEVLNPSFQKLLALDEPPLGATAAWAAGASRKPVQVASALLFVLHKALTVTLLCLAAYSLPYRWWSVTSIGFAWGFLAVTAVAEITLLNAMKRVLVSRPRETVRKN